MHIKPNYAQLASSDGFSAQLKQIDMYAAMLTLYDYTRQSLDKARRYILEWDERTQDHRGMNGMPIAKRVEFYQKLQANVHRCLRAQGHEAQR